MVTYERTDVAILHKLLLHIIIINYYENELIKLIKLRIIEN